MARPPVALTGSSIGTDDILASLRRPRPRRSPRCVRPSTVGASPWSRPGRLSSSRMTRPSAAGVVQVGSRCSGRPAAGRRRSASGRRRPRTRRCRARCRIRGRSPAGAARRSWTRPSRRPRRSRSRATSRVTKRDGRTSWRTRSMTSSPDRRAASSLAGSSAGMPLRPAGERPMNSRAIDIVLAVNWPPHAPGPGHDDVLDLVQLVEGDLARPGRRRSPRRPTRRSHCAARVASRDRSCRCTGSGRGRRGGRGPSRRPGSVLSQPTRQTTPSSRWPRTTSSIESATTSRLTRLRLHALGAHRHAVADADGVELHRRAAGRADAGLDVFGQPALVVVARHRLDPGRARPRSAAWRGPRP